MLTRLMHSRFLTRWLEQRRAEDQAPSRSPQEWQTGVSVLHVDYRRALNLFPLPQLGSPNFRDLGELSYRSDTCARSIAGWLAISI